MIFAGGIVALSPLTAFKKYGLGKMPLPPPRPDLL